MGSLAVSVSEIPVILADNPSILEFQVTVFRKSLQFANRAIVSRCLPSKVNLFWVILSLSAQLGATSWLHKSETGRFDQAPRSIRDP